MTNIPTVTLNNGIEMPLLGLGVYAPRHNSDVQQAVEWALEAGYRLIDTASAYGNEHEVASAIQASGLSRNEVFVTTKVWTTDQGYDQTLRAFDQSMSKLQLDVLDLYLIHWPDSPHRLDTWRAMEKLYADKRVRAIGVSNYYPHHLNELLAVAHVTPAVNQFEFSPFCYLPDVLTYCRTHGIQPEGYAPLVRGEKQQDPILVALAKKYDKSTYQLLVRWSVQHGVVTIPKSVNHDRIRHNADVLDFVITDDDMAQLNLLYDNTRIATDPRDIP